MNVLSRTQRVAVVPVALAARGLGQRGRRGGDHRAGGRVAQALQRQRDALQVLAPRVVRERAVREPLVPVVGGLDEPVVGLARRSSGRGARRTPARRTPCRRRAACVTARTREPSKPTRRSVVSVSLVAQPSARRDGLAVAVADVLPVRVAAPVVEDRVALDLDLDRAVDAAHGAQQHVVGVVVRGRAAVRGRALLGVVPGADQQHVAHDQPAAARCPSGSRGSSCPGR